MEIAAHSFFLRERKFLFLILICIVTLILLQGCASSDVAKDASSQFHSTVAGARSAFDGQSIDIAESYQGASQATKGALIGGTTGAVVGGVAMGGSGLLPAAAGGAIFGGALGAYIDSRTSVRDQIINRGNKVIVLGDQVLIVLPSKAIFTGESATLQPYAYRTLDLVSRLVSGYANILVKVSVYTASTEPERITRSLSQEQANAVVKYLWRTHINTRMLYAEGEGGIKPLVATGSEINNRVEITLEKLPV